MKNMDGKKRLDNFGSNRKRRNTGNPFHSFLFITMCTVIALLFSISLRITDDSEKDRVYAAADSEGADGDAFEKDCIPSGIAGVIYGVNKTASSKKAVERIGTSCEEVMVGQRVKTVENTVAEFNASSSIESKVNDFGEKTIELAQNPKIMSDTDYDTLLRIVEAEAGTEDVKGRILVANVIMNRVKNEEFPDSVTEVVWDYSNGVPQFSPTYDGRIGEVTVSDETREAVKQVLEGVDYSEGALFFIQKSEAEAHNVTWFEKDLKKLFKYGVHEFYTYPDEGEEMNPQEDQKQVVDMTTDNSQLVCMVENTEVK